MLKSFADFLMTVLLSTTATPDMVQTIFTICLHGQGVHSSRALQLFIHWGSVQKTLQKCVLICKFESLSPISHWCTEIDKYNCSSSYGTNYFCNFLARAGCAQFASFAIIHSLGFIGGKLCRNAVSIDSSKFKSKAQYRFHTGILK